jgi:hypothetical protein
MIGGWLLILCLLLLVWQPLSLGLVASSVIDSLAVRGLSLALVLALRVVVTAFGIAAGLALVGRRAGAVTLAKTSLIASATTDTFIYATPYFPHNRPPPGDTLAFAASLAYYGIWLAYLVRSKRVRSTYGPV